MSYGGKNSSPVVLSKQNTYNIGTPKGIVMESYFNATARRKKETDGYKWGGGVL